MPKYCISEYTGAGTEFNPYRPLGVDDNTGWSAIDFRPDSTKLDGFCIVAYPDDATLPKTVIQIADYKASKLNLSTKTLFSNKIGLNIETENFDEILLELLTTHATPPNDKSRWNPIMYTVDKRFEIWLDEKIVDIPFVGGGATYTEDFNVADVNPLVNGDLTWASVLDNFRVTSNQVLTNGVTTYRMNRCTSNASTDNNYAQITIVSTDTTSTTTWGICARYGTGDDCYFGTQGTGSAVNTTQIQKNISFAYTSLGTSTYTKVTNEVIKFEANGSTLTFYCDGASNISLTDTSHTTGKQGGIIAKANTSAARTTMDNWEFGDVTVSATTSPSTISRSFAINAPAVNSNNVATVIARSFAVNTPTVTADSTLTATAIARSFTMPAPTVAGGSGAYPDIIALSVSIPAPTVTGDSVVTDVATADKVITSRRRKGSIIGKTKTN